MNTVVKLILASMLLASPSVVPGGEVMTEPQKRIQAAKGDIGVKATPFALNSVRLLDGPFRDAMQRDRDYLLSLEPDRLLHTFRLTAGLPTTAKPYGGWESPQGELRGHSMGHYLSACAAMAAGTGDGKLKANTEYIVAELAKCQAALPGRGFHKGFLSAYPESFFDRVDACQRVWAPYYTLHKIMAGLLDVHQLCGNSQALAILEGMADWLKFRIDRLPVEQQQKALGCEHGGMVEVLANLYAITGNPEHLKLARAFEHRAVFDPLERGEDRLDGMHANTQIPKIIGAAREYEVTGDERYRKVASFFWERVALHRSYAIGGDSDREHFFPIDRFGDHLAVNTCETCNSYNMLKLTRHLFAWAPSCELMDFYERALYNHILASQDPKTGMFVYFPSLKPGHFKTYSTPENSFWCCVGTGMENHARYAESIYWHDAAALYLNLFIPSELTWKEKGLTLRQETKFPESDTTQVTLKCEGSVAMELKIRYPSWARDGLTVTVNGRAEKLDGAPGAYVTLKREWRDGDRVEIRAPMKLHLEELPGNPDTVAILYGPVVLAGGLGVDGMPNPYARDQCDFNGVPSPEVPVFLGDAKKLLGSIHAVAGEPLTFQTRDIGRPRDVTLIPFYRMHHQRYSVYWKLFTEEAWTAKQAEVAADEARRKAEEARMVDSVGVGEPQSERDHNFAGEKTNTGEYLGRKWRDARGWFSYELKMSPEQETVLACTYWGGETGQRAFDVLVDGQKLASQTLNNNKPGKFFDVEYNIPKGRVAGKTRVNVKFQAHEGSIAGGVFDCAILKAK